MGCQMLGLVSGDERGSGMAGQESVQMVSLRKVDGSDEGGGLTEEVKLFKFNHGTSRHETFTGKILMNRMLRDQKRSKRSIQPHFNFCPICGTKSFYNQKQNWASDKLHKKGQKTKLISSKFVREQINAI